MDEKCKCTPLVTKPLLWKMVSEKTRLRQWVIPLISPQSHWQDWSESKLIQCHDWMSILRLSSLAGNYSSSVDVSVDNDVLSSTYFGHYLKGHLPSNLRLLVDIIYIKPFLWSVQWHVISVNGAGGGDRIPLNYIKIFFSKNEPVILAQTKRLIYHSKQEGPQAVLYPI